MTTTEVLQPPALPNATDAGQHSRGIEMPLSLQQPLCPEFSLDAGEQMAGLGFAKKGASWAKDAGKMVSFQATVIDALDLHELEPTSTQVLHPSPFHLLTDLTLLMICSIS